MRNKFVVLGILLLVFSAQIVLAGEVYFSPNGGCTKKVIETIDQANSSIEVAMFSFTSQPIYQALVRARQRGVKIQVLLDRQQAQSKYSVYHALEQQGIRVILDQQAGYMHNKICLVDSRVVLTGSFNWTENAEKKNQENMVVLTEKSMVDSFRQQLEKLFKLNSLGLNSSPSPKRRKLTRLFFLSFFIELYLYFIVSYKLQILTNIQIFLANQCEL